MKTKKLLVEVKLPEGKVGKQYLIPNFNNTNGGFLNIKTHKNVSYGIVIYIGIEISSEDLLNKYLENTPIELEKEKCLGIMDTYLNQINKFKIGNVLSVKYEDGKLKLKKKLERVSENTRTLP